MRLILSIIIIFCSVQLLCAQDDCGPGVITVSSQAEVDSFKDDHPGCIYLDRFFISGEDITDLKGLSHLKDVSNYFSISNTSLTHLRDISKLLVQSDEFHIVENPKLETLDGLNLYSAFQQFSIRCNDMLTDITALGSIDHIDNDITVINNPLLEVCCVIEDIVNTSRYDELKVKLRNNAIGCNSLEEVSCCCSSDCECVALNECGNIYLNSQADLDNFNDLYGECSYIDTVFINGEDITELKLGSQIPIPDYISITNTSATDLDQFYISSSKAKLSISILGNEQLSNCCILENAIASDGSFDHNIVLGDNAEGCNSTEEILTTCSCDKVTLRSQDDINNFREEYGYCRSIGELYIRQDEDLGAIVDLQGLEGLERITKGLHISYANLPNLDDLAALSLDGIEFLEIWENQNLTDINGLKVPEVLTKVQISNNPLLVDITALSSLVEVEDWFNIGNNDSLASLNGIQNLESASRIVINRLPLIIDLDELSNVSEAEELRVIGNGQLINIEGVGNINGIERLIVKDNQQLSICCSVSNTLFTDDIDTWATIESNANGCNSTEEIEEECMIISSTGNKIDTANFTISPNPFNDNIMIKCSSISQDATINIYDINGKLVLRNEMDDEEKILDASLLSEGVYMISIQNAASVYTTKLIKH